MKIFLAIFVNMGRVGGGRLPLLMTPGAELKGEWQCGGGKPFFFPKHITTSLLDITLAHLYYGNMAAGQMMGTCNVDVHKYIMRDTQRALLTPVNAGVWSSSWLLRA